MAEGRVFLAHILAAVLLQQRLHLAIGFLRVDVIGADHVSLFAAWGVVYSRTTIVTLRVDYIGSYHVALLAAERADDPRHEIVELLVRHGAGVEAVLGALLGLVKRGIEQNAVVLLEDRQTGLARGRGVAAEHGHDLV